MNELKTENGWIQANRNTYYKLFSAGRLAVWRAGCTDFPVRPAMCWIFNDNFELRHVFHTSMAEIDTMLDPQPEQVIRGQTFTVYRHGEREGVAVGISENQWFFGKLDYGRRELAEAAAREFVMKGGA